MHTIALENAQALRKGRRTSALVAATNNDAALINGAWHTLDTTPQGEPVQRVRHFNRHDFEVGDRLRVEDIEGRPQVTATIAGISLVHTDALSDAQVQSTGYADIAALHAKIGHRRAWLYSFTQVRPMLRWGLL